MKQSLLKNFFLVLLFNFLAIDCDEHLFIHNLVTELRLERDVYDDLIQNAKQEEAKFEEYSGDLPLFTMFPHLRKKLPYKRLGDFPTPVQKLNILSDRFNVNLYVKRDDLTGKLLFDGSRLFGGNKVRKLELLLAHAIEQGARGVMTYGCVGSNHAVATSAYAQFLGLDSITMLKPQPISHVVHRNLLLMDRYNACMVLSSSNEDRLRRTVTWYKRCKNEMGYYPYFIPTGGSNARGALGYVNAIFELCQQISSGQTQVPNVIYMPAGSFGTVSGALLGVLAAGLPTKIVAVAVEPSQRKQLLAQIHTFFNEINVFLRELDPSIPEYIFSENRLEVVTDCAGKDYGVFTPEGVRAIKFFAQQENLIFDGTYTGKMASAVLRDLESGVLKGKTVLIWNTFFSEETKVLYQNYKQLPISFHTYFENPVQLLDR